MMKRFLFVFSLLMTACMVASAQGRNKVSGSVVEFESNEAVTGATVRLLSLPDSALVVGTTTDVEGKFLLNNVRRGKYVLVVSFIGYVTKEKMVDLSNRRSGTLDAGRIVIVENSELLEGVEVTAMASKVQVSGDSLMFNASAYPVPEGSTLEALIKMLPGAKVDEDGNITINGKTVSKILVEGKEFFLNDKSVAMKNIPTEMIDKLKTLTSVYQAEELERIRDIAGRPKNRNEGIFYTIDSLHFAIQHKRKVHFSYYRHVIRDGRIIPQKSHEFTVSPYALIWNDGKYYLVANYGKYDNFSHYRLDRMRQVEVLLEPSRPLNEFSRYDEELDETDYISGVFGMYAGKEEDYVYLRCSGDCLEHLIDRFGHELLCEVNGDESFTVRVKALINDGLVSWILAQRGGVQAMYPPELSDRVRQTLAAMLEAL